MRKRMTWSRTTIEHGERKRASISSQVRAKQHPNSALLNIYTCSLSGNLERIRHAKEVALQQTSPADGHRPLAISLAHGTTPQSRIVGERSFPYPHRVLVPISPPLLPAASTPTVARLPTNMSYASLSCGRVSSAPSGVPTKCWRASPPRGVGLLAFITVNWNFLGVR